MIKVRVDEKLRATLHNMDEPLELCDATGKTLGHYVPAPNTRNEPEFSAEEVARRRGSPGGRSLEEIWKRLGRTVGTESRNRR